MDSSGRCYAILKNCIRQHQALIQFSITLEEIFTIITLGQVLIFSTLICFVGYQVLLVSYYYNFLFYWKFLQFFQFKFNILLLNNFLGAVNTFYLREKLLLHFLFLPVSHYILKKILTNTINKIFSVFIEKNFITPKKLYYYLIYLIININNISVTQVNLTFSWRISFLCFLITNMCQLWMFTYSCDCMTRESVNVASAVYSIPWTRIPMDKFGKMIRKDLQFVVVRSRRACSLTGCGFFAISLETYTKVIVNHIIKKVNPFFEFLFQ